jgi:hypothetical protein
MGHSLSWAAVKDGIPEEVHSILEVRPTGRREEIPDSEIVGAVLPSKWYLTLFHRAEFRNRTLERLSRVGEVIYCFVEDHIMFSCASGWKDGKALWSVTHDSEKGISHLQVQGQVPEVFPSIREGLTTRQDAENQVGGEVDHIYDIPAELARALTSFRHDQALLGTTGDIFEVLERINNPQPPTAYKNPFRWLFFGKSRV